jgi:hypothetical protein
MQNIAQIELFQMQIIVKHMQASCLADLQLATK